MAGWQSTPRKPNWEKLQLILFALIFIGAFTGLGVAVWAIQFLLGMAG